MVAKNGWSIYRKLLILGLFSGCLLYFGYFDKIGIVSAAAPCEQECEELKQMCLDDCAQGALACDANSTDAACNSCISSCSTDYNACMASAVWCGSYGYSYTPECQVGYGDHCPIINGVANCSDPSAHSGYYMVCNLIGGQCVKCPDHDYCVGSNGLPSCP